MSASCPETRAEGSPERRSGSVRAGVCASATISVVAPIYNEGDRVHELVERLRALSLIDQIVLVDDGSTDGAEQYLSTLEGDPQVTLVSHRYNQGKGAALRSGIDAAEGDVVIIQDADLEYLPEDIPRLIDPILTGQAEVVYGTRYALRENSFGSPLQRIANWVLTKFSNWRTGLQLTDMETGYKAFRRGVLESIDIEENRFGVEPELTAKAAKLGVRFVEQPIRYRPRRRRDGKKIGYRDGLHAIRCILRY